MASAKVLFCDLCIILLFGITIALEDEELSSPPIVDEGPKGNCSCGGFPMTTPEVEQAPLLSQTPGLLVKCDDEGATTCKNLCNALAIATKAKGPEILCNRLKDADELKLSAFYKVCDKPWTYADMTADESLCCADAKVKVCASAKGNSTETAETKPAA